MSSPFSSGFSVSVVVNTYNRAATLRDTLKGLMGLRYQSFEVVVVNGPSTDDTEAVLQDWQGRIKLARCKEVNLSVSRNIGIETAAGDIIAFIDDDAVPHPDWLIELTRQYADPAVGAVGGFTIDNTGVRYQVRKTICDRFGNAYSVSPFFDERPLCVPGNPFYPSLLGTNSSFRRSVLQEIGGFDHAFAYLLDETDVCLRTIDAGYLVHYAPRALVFHQFAESHIRSTRRIPKTLYPSAISKSYFIMRHGARASIEAAGQALEAYRRELSDANKWLCDHGDISAAHHASLDQDIAWGILKGSTLGQENLARSGGDLVVPEPPPEFLAFEAGRGMRIAFVSQSFVPHSDAGIARWTSMMAAGLAERGHHVHVITRADKDASIRFTDGYWVHRIKDDPLLAGALMAAHDLPPNIAAWAGAVKTEIAAIKTFGLDCVSFPIWDVEGIGIVDDPDVSVVMSLHTTYALAKPFKPEWQARPLYSHLTVDKIIARETDLLRQVPTVLANSQAIIDDLTRTYGVDFADRAVLALHGTLDPLADDPERVGLRKKRKSGFEVAFVGRVEPRKGFDIAVGAIARLLDTVPNATAVFVGDPVMAKVHEEFLKAGAAQLLDDPRVSFRGLVSRAVLDDIYASADAVIMPSRYESFGLVAIEAMAAGAAIVAVRAGGLAEVVRHGETGFLVDLNGREASTAAAHLIDLARDRPRCEAMGKAARADFLARFTIKAMVEQAERAYVQAIELRRDKQARKKRRAEANGLEAHHGPDR
jgi:glycosyltransferase involved in cell wall biosynthesis/GT2 family glycosyltransferase